MGKVIYLGYYDTDGKRVVSPACVTMMDYVISSINKAGYELTVVSPAVLKTREKSEYEEKQINEKTKCIYLPSPAKSGSKFSPTRIWNNVFRNARLLQDLLRIVEDGDTLIVYHSLLLMKAVRQIQKIRKICLILQVCEVYSDVLENVSSKARRRELDFIGTADKYIFSTQLLADMFHSGKEYAVCLGTYRSEPEYEKCFHDDKIHVVYSGTLDPRKGAFTAVEIGLYLSEKYHLHILGFGDNAQVAGIKDKIETTSQKTSAQITYEGVLLGSEYKQFLSSCDIGLCPQNPTSKYNATSFPSKILSYMTNGLQIVSVRLPAIETSAIGSLINYYDEQDPNAIAKAIMEIDINGAAISKVILNQLDCDFCNNLKGML